MREQNLERREFRDYRPGVSFLNNELRLKEILKHKGAGKLLDVGCACGFFLKFAQEHFDTYGIEISREAAEKAKEIAPGAEVIRCDAQDRYPFGDNSFDIVTAFDVIEHLRDPATCLDEVFRVLKPDGYLFLQTPTDKSRDIIRDDTHVSLFSKDELLSALEGAGFQTVCARKRRSILYVNRFLDRIIRLFKPGHGNLVIDNYKTVSSSSSSRISLLKRIKIVAYGFDKLISSFTPAPEIFVVAKKRT